MEKRNLGNTGIQVSPIGLGTVKFGRNQQVKYPTAFELPDDKTVQHLLNQAYDLGINLLDTAPAYGISEERIGKLLPHARQNWVISTKVGEQFKDGQSQFDFSASAVQQSVENSLRKLKTDYLDSVLIHSNGLDTAILTKTDVLPALFSLKKKGYIRTVGMSSKTVEGGMLAFELGCDTAMVAFNPLYEEELSVIQTAATLEKGIFIKKAFSSGHLNRFQQKNPIRRIFKHIFKEKAVSSVIVGTINPKHLRENVVEISTALKIINT